jgi:hypothetical protein
MRAAPILVSILCLAACGSTRPLEVPPPYDESGILVTVKPRAYVEWPLSFETIRGTVENRTGRDVDLRLYLNLEDETGAVVGHAFAYLDGLARGATCKFEAYAEEGPPRLFHFSLFPATPTYTRVARGFAYNDDSVVGLATYVWWFSRPEEATRPPPRASDPGAPARGP